MQKNSSSLALTQAPPVPKWSLQYYRHGSYQTAAPINISPSLPRWLTHLPTVTGRRGRETEILETCFKNLLLQSYATLLLHEDQLPMPWLERKMGLHWGVIPGVLSAHQALTPLCLSLLNSLTGELLSSRPVSSRTVGATQRNPVLNLSPNPKIKQKAHFIWMLVILKLIIHQYFQCLHFASEWSNYQ